MKNVLCFLIIFSVQQLVAQKLTSPFKQEQKSIHIESYFDHNSDFGQATDYTGGNWSYDDFGSRYQNIKTDIVASSYRRTDEGILVFPMKDGIVDSVFDGFIDRNYEQSLAQKYKSNRVFVRSSDGTGIYYLHLRKGIPVKVGDYVSPETFIGLMGGSGYVDKPTLGIIVYDESGNAIDMFNTDPVLSLFENGIQPEYFGRDTLRVKDACVTTLEELYSYPTFQKAGLERPTEPLQIGKSFGSFGNGHYIAFWVNFYAQLGDSIGVSFIDPHHNIRNVLDNDGDVVKVISTPLDQQYRTGNYLDFLFLGDLSVSDYGLWRMNVLYKDSVVYSVPFNIGSTTTYPVRMKPNGLSAQVPSEGELNLLVKRHSKSPQPSYSLEKPKDGVAITTYFNGDMVITIDGNTILENRNELVKILIAGPNSEVDTFKLHLYDLDIPLPSPALPVEISTHNVEIDGEMLRMVWKTESEENNAGFMVYVRNLHSQTWIKLADYNTDENLRGQGSSTLSKQYIFQKPIGLWDKVKLVQVDMDGKKKDIFVEALNSNPVTPNIFGPYPNPGNPGSISVYVPENEFVVLKIYNIIGQEVFTKNIISSNTYPLPINLASGMYIIQVNNNQGFQKTLKWNLLK